MSAPHHAQHWSDRFPDLRAPDPRLEILRTVLRDADPAQPLVRLRHVLERALHRKQRAVTPDLGPVVGLRGGPTVGPSVGLRVAEPGQPEQTFDERWLLAVFEAQARVDLRGYQFLLRSRLQAGDAARVHFALVQAQLWLEARL